MTRCMRDERDRLHCEDGAAIQYPDGWGVYSWHGVRVPMYVILEPEKITVDAIEAESNAEVRRVMVERFGLERFIKESGAKRVHQDDFGTLYRKELANDEPIVMVHVVNSTAEPDGSFNDYFIRVPPTIERAKQAVAWTFGKEEREYEPAMQT